MINLFEEQKQTTVFVGQEDLATANALAIAIAIVIMILAPVKIW